MELTQTEFQQAIAEIAARSLAEDVGAGDVTTEALFGAKERCLAEMIVKEPGVVCGLPVLRGVFSRLEAEVGIERLVEEGEWIDRAPFSIVRLTAQARALFTGERVALNLLSRLSGIATLTRKFVEAVRGTGVEILDTRKTTPGLRILEKYAVRIGGGANHRFGLFDAVLVKDNHLKVAGGIEEAVRRIRAVSSLPIEIEADTIEQVEQALVVGVERILLDNMAPDQVARAVELVAARAQLEVSGGVNLDNVREYAETGVEAISIGALTHSAPALDISMEVQGP
jgi:nicotinate-nucleotide pyrophosphorylase (carboxylating)